jgi:hypothetical protein
MKPGKKAAWGEDAAATSGSTTAVSGKTKRAAKAQAQAALEGVSVELALAHRDATCPRRLVVDESTGKTAPQPYDVCGDDFPTERFAIFGTGVLLYFRFLRKLALAFVLIMFVTLPIYFFNALATSPLPPSTAASPPWCSSASNATCPFTIGHTTLAVRAIFFYKHSCGCCFCWCFWRWFGCIWC